MLLIFKILSQVY